MHILSRLNTIRVLLFLGALSIILILLPHPDRQSYSYELNQPWRYPLLTADFDMPIMRDSASVHRMHDSIEAAFVPFVKRSDEIEKSALERFSRQVGPYMAPAQSTALRGFLNEVYSRGIIDQSLYDKASSHGHLREALPENGAYTLSLVDASRMLSPRKAFEYIDSAYRSHPGLNQTYPLGEDCIKALNICLTPNVVLDSVTNEKYLSQEYLTVNSAQGIIKGGQRIVDRGEIVTPQIFTNLNTYLDMLEKNSDAGHEHTYFFIGQGLYIALCFAGLYAFLWFYRRKFFDDPRKMCFLVCFITLFVAFSIVMSEYFANGLYLVPFAAVPVVILIFFDDRTAIFSLLVTVMISALVAIFPLQFIFLELLAGLVAAFSLNQLSQRAQLLRVAAFTFLAYCIGFVAMQLISTGTIEMITWRIIGVFAINSVVLSFAYILILVIEKLFGFTSMVTLIELSDINNPLLRRLASEAPGTFQHSIQVSTLASEAARAIGANTQLVRTGALYHDVGKLESPIFFTENQHGINPHTGLNPETSARKIISHVTDGLTIARNFKLPQVVRNFISEHHGKAVTRYFYNTAVNENNGEPVDREPYTYPGPNPQSRETAILMMADCVEAASRSLKTYTQQSIDELVDKIIDNIVAEGLLKEAPISFSDVEKVKDTFKKRLATIYHSRVAYPDVNRKEDHDRAAGDH